MSAIEAIYHRCPIPVQNAMVTAWGAVWYSRRFGRHFYEKVRELEQNEKLTSEQFAAWQLRSLNAVLEQAAKAPYYRQQFQEARLTLPLKSLEQLAELPRLSKQVLRSQPTDLLTTTPPWGTKVLHSSGTTGTPTSIYFTRNFHQEHTAYFQARHRQWAGIGQRDSRAMFGIRKVCAFEQSRPPFWRKSAAENMYYYSVYHLAPAFLPSYVEHLRKFRPKVIMGYPSALNVVARHLLGRGETIPVQAVLTTSETVTNQIRAAVEAAFECRLFDQYGCVENTHFVSQCEYGSYHVSPERGIIEILDGDQPCPPGKEGKVVVTGLENQLQPLIRYELGDVSYWAEDQSCPCNRQMPIMGGISGRVEDYCVTPDGRQILRFDAIFKATSNIVEGQIIQEEADRFTVRVVPTSAYSVADEERIRAAFRNHAGNATLDIEMVENIPRTSNGKFRAVINRSRPSTGVSAS
ncbi:MAG: phenylacetate--CoA ligase family protein [Pirellulaceae bacterium]